MQRRNSTRILMATALLTTCGTLLIGTGGCYRKVVDSRGIGADSTKLRSEYESRPLDFMTSESRRDKREVRSAREREK